MITPTILKRILFLLAAFALSASLTAHGQLTAVVDVDVTEQDGIFTYEYSVTNGFLSSTSINVFAVSVAVGTDVAIGESFTEEEAEMGALGLRLPAPEGWAGAYDPRLPVFADDDPNTPRNESCDVIDSRQLSSSFQVGWVVGDGFTLRSTDPNGLFPGSTQTFTLQSEYGPELQDYLIANLDNRTCPEGFFGLAEGQVLAPTIAPPRPELTCDFDGDDDCDPLDLNLLSQESAAGTNSAEFDLNNDTFVNLADIDEFLGLAKVQKINGDHDFNGAVEFADFLVLSTNFATEGVWSGGDFSGNGFVDFADFLILSSNFGQTFEGGGVAAASVPEPSAGLLALISVLGLASLRRTRVEMTM